MKTLIILPYYERPELVKNALYSILHSDYYHKDWELAFIDDGSINQGKSVVESILHPVINKVKFYKSEFTKEDKMERGSELGRLINLAMVESDASLCVALNDDDKLVPNYLTNLSNFMENNPTCQCCFSKIHLNFPYAQKNKEYKILISLLDKYCPYNQWKGRINPYLTVEWCQVSWRLPVPVRFDEYCDANHDAFFFKRMANALGERCCWETGFFAQWKTYHARQASRRAFDPNGRWGSDPSVLYTDPDFVEDDNKIILEEAIAQAKFWFNYNRPEISKAILEEAIFISQDEKLIKLLNELDIRTDKFKEIDSYHESLNNL